MSPIARSLQHLNSSASLPGVLDAACVAFETLLAEIRAHEDPDSPMFAALVMAAASAADGRDAVLLAPSLPWPPTPPEPELPAAAGLADGSPGVIELMAALCQALVSRLRQVAGTAADSRDQNACRAAIRSARAAGDLLAGTSR